MKLQGTGFIRFLQFGWMQALCCIFPVVIFSALGLTKYIDVPWMPRYDLILLICIAAQAAMYFCKLETIDELKVITLFHIIGLGLELFKVHMGSWAYPEDAWSKVFGVPLYSGFMYASVASYICQAWRRFDLQIRGWPHYYAATGIAILIYANFFTHHWIGDWRWVLILGLIVLFFRTRIIYHVGGKAFKMHAIVAYALIALFIWLAENISTFLGAWRYPNQEMRWSMVHLGKLSSWFLLVIISIIIIVQLKDLKYRALPANPNIPPQSKSG